MADIVAYPAAGGDDYAFDYGGSSFDNSATTESVTNTSFFGTRFANVAVPQGAEITSAHIVFTAGGNQASGSSLEIFSDTSGADPSAPTDYAGASNIPRSTAVSWDSVGAWTTGSQYESADITSLVQAIVNLAGWASGQHMQFFLSRRSMGGGQNRVVKTYEDTGSAELHISYIEGTTINMTGIPLAAAPAMSLGSAFVNTFLSEDLPALEISATGTSRSASLRKDLSALEISAHGLSGTVARILLELPALQGAASGLSGEIAEGDISLPGLLISSSGGPSGPSVLSGTLPFFYIVANGREIPAQAVYKTMAMNLRTGAVTLYDETFGFNSFAQFNGIMIGAKEDGLYPLVGDSDRGAQIYTVLTTGKVYVEHFRLRDLFIYGLDGGQRRAKLPRGIHSGYTEFTIENIEGENLDLDYFEVLGDPVRRKRH